MKMDSRIIDKTKVFNAYDIDEAKYYIGQKCIFGYVNADFAELNKYLPVGTLKNVIDDGVIDPFISDDGKMYPFCTPFSNVKL